MGRKECAALCRSVCEKFTKPVAKCIRYCCRWERCAPLPEYGPIGTHEETLLALAACARLVYGTGFIDEETCGKFDPPLDGEGWRVVDQICETRGSPTLIQAACYVKDSIHHESYMGTPAWFWGAHHHSGVAIVAFRGTVSFKGILQDLSLWSPVTGPTIRRAIKEACSFYLKCQDMHPSKHIYVTGHSLGGYIAEAVASYMDVEGAVFNSPGPWSHTPLSNVTGPYRPDFEIHLTRSDPLALAVFPKPENSAHIGKPVWHEGTNHRLCQPYMREVENMRGVAPNKLPFDPRDAVNQLEALEHLYPPPELIDYFSDDGSVSSDGL